MYSICPLVVPVVHASSAGLCSDTKHIITYKIRCQHVFSSQYFQPECLALVVCGKKEGMNAQLHSTISSHFLRALVGKTHFWLLGFVFNTAQTGCTPVSQVLVPLTNFSYWLVNVGCTRRR